MTDTARWADYILPAATLFEREDLVKGPGPYLQYQPQILAPRGEARSDFDIAASLAERLGGPNSLAASAFSDSPRRYLEGMLPELAPELTPKQQAAFFATGLAQIEARQEPGVAFRSLEFKTPTGRIEFYQEERLAQGRALPVYEPPAEADPESETARRFPLVCITEHNFYRVHSSFNKSRWLRELDGEPGVTLHPHEASTRGICEGDVVRVFNERGFVVLHARLSKSVPTGMAIFSQGWQASDFIAGHAQSLTHWQVRQHPVFGANISFSDVLVEVARAEEA
jgi:anaerobic selenocysteine-containing dehydrogenase